MKHNAKFDTNVIFDYSSTSEVLNPLLIGVSTQGHSRAMPYKTESKEQLLLSEELTLS